jgi:hypothetical protein
MERTPAFVSGLVILLIACILIAGCSSTDTTNPDTQPGTTTNPAALFTAGDIVKNPASTVTTAWLILGYDAASDTYERAQIYQNPDASWGYREDNRTEKAGRSVMEKVYTEKVANTPPSSVPIGMPTPIATEEETTFTTEPVTTVTTVAPLAPHITNIIPDEGYAGTSVSVTDLVGENFVNGATITLSRNGSATITATGVRAVTNTSIICTFAIPSDAPVGAWDVSVKNPDGQSATFTNIFTVHRTTNVQVTTVAIHSGSVPITDIHPPNGFSTAYQQYTITGSGFETGARVYLERTGVPDIEATSVIVNSATQLQCFLDPPTGSFGVWDLKIVNPDNTYGIWHGGFTIS